LQHQLPLGFVAEPSVHIGSTIKVDIATFEQDEQTPFSGSNIGDGTATALWAPSEPTLTIEAERPDDYEYEVRIYDEAAGLTLVAAIEIVSPANKDRPGSRTNFVEKCNALVRKGIAVSIVDLVTNRHFNLYAETLELLGHADPMMSAEPPATYAASLRWGPRGKRNRLEAWSYPLEVGKPLPTLPIWLSETLAIPLDLEAGYEQTCRDLRIS